jgi:hypothetical protein
MAEEKWKRVDVRLSDAADQVMRTALLGRRGDISEGIRRAILSTNWDDIQIVKRRGMRQRFWRTSFLISLPVYENLKEFAQKKNTDVSTLIDAIILSYYSRPHDEL